MLQGVSFILHAERVDGEPEYKATYRWALSGLFERFQGTKINNQIT